MQRPETEATHEEVTTNKYILNFEFHCPFSTSDMRFRKLFVVIMSRVMSRLLCHIKLPLLHQWSLSRIIHFRHEQNNNFGT